MQKIFLTIGIAFLLATTSFAQQPPQALAVDLADRMCDCGRELAALLSQTEQMQNPQAREQMQGQIMQKMAETMRCMGGEEALIGTDASLSDQQRQRLEDEIHSLMYRRCPEVAQALTRH